MAAGDITRGARTALANVSRLHSNANGVAEAFGEVDTGVSVAIDVHLVVPISATAIGGTYDLYLVESQDGAEWTDNIDPASAGDVAAKRADATHLVSVDTVYNATHRAEARFHVGVDLLGRPQHLGFLLVNASGQAIPATGAAGHYELHTVS